MSKTHNRWHNFWTDEDDRRLMQMVENKEMSHLIIANMLNRTENAVSNRIRVLRKDGAISPCTRGKSHVTAHKPKGDSIYKYAPVQRRLPRVTCWNFENENLEIRD